ncbi:MAG TPA: LacI family transcriptional regulator [Spirochaetaceae bacterium]|jgi:LacI family transcriptional regulator|nr:LacI family transcriptional regulator [Spirochaetaceae bacterium]
MSSIRDVAKLAGVSVSTVSRVLAGSQSVEKETRRRVEQAIETIGYQPNLLAQGLRSKRGSLIGLVVPEINHETFSRFIEYIGDEVRTRGYSLITGNTHGQPDIEDEFIESLLRRHVDGIIFSRVSDRSRALRILEKGKVPAVIIDRFLDNEDIPTIIIDNYGAGVLAAEHLINLGHRSFAVITGPQNIALCRERQKGFADYIERQGCTFLQHNVYEGTFKFEAGIEAAENFLKNGIDFTAIWAENDLMALGAMNTFIRANKKVPEEISIMGMDNIISSKIMIPSLTTISQPFAAMCSKAVELLFSMMNSEECSERRIVLPASLIVRESTAQCTKQI